MRKVILILLIVCTCLGSAQLALQVLFHQLHPNVTLLHKLGDQFKGLETLLSNQRTIGYYTDKNMDNALAVAQFEQAQYLLAPTVLDFNHTQYSFTIFDCTSPQVALEKIKALGLKPVKANNFGIILAVNPSAEGLNP
jgi:hypothetical protein